MVRRALRRVHRLSPFRSVLDLPSGAGRFLPVFAEFDASLIAMDTSSEMLQKGRRLGDLFDEAPHIIAGSALEIPLADDSVDVAVCIRLLHHFKSPELRIRTLQELARVARVAVVATFFDSTSFYAWKSERKARRRGRESRRYAISRPQCEQEARSAGLKLIGMNTLLRYHAQITAAAFLPDTSR